MDRKVLRTQHCCCTKLNIGNSYQPLLIRVTAILCKARLYPNILAYSQNYKLQNVGNEDTGRRQGCNLLKIVKAYL
jgi:hypothetical protein